MDTGQHLHAQGADDLGRTNTPFELITIDFATGEHKQPPEAGRPEIA